ncbi:hypothetical protein [Zobellia galactanivorans]|uniref:hypothetical protein n=1 Tax=Zobellia galactanivorans (strain DSM 12802 / CCUG 47099 / CIP 106680 / NCIMB 13871 / Dsij) TaxID=63186 RepID=UPI001C076DBA|nr:hypothetical protein [Zobellia galactanivorans]MBU3024530.1 hypothetical protein [Zobellia galactanivorans]
MKRTLVFSILLFLALLGCKSPRYSFDELPDVQLVFGKGGGMAGMVDTYILLQNGQLFHHNSVTETTKELQALSKKEASAFFMGIEELGLSEIDFYHPGNSYFFLEEVKENQRHRVVWGAKDHKLSKDCLEFYKELKSHIK